MPNTQGNSLKNDIEIFIMRSTTLNSSVKLGDIIPTVFLLALKVLDDFYMIKALISRVTHKWCKSYREIIRFNAFATVKLTMSPINLKWDSDAVLFQLFRLPKDRLVSSHGYAFGFAWSVPKNEWRECFENCCCCIGFQISSVGGAVLSFCTLPLARRVKECRNTTNGSSIRFYLSEQLIDYGAYCSTPKLLTGKLLEFVSDPKSKGTIVVAFGDLVFVLFSLSCHYLKLYSPLENTAVKVPWSIGVAFPPRSSLLYLMPWIRSPTTVSYGDITAEM